MENKIGERANGGPVDASKPGAEEDQHWILLVDDERAVRRVGEKALMRAGFNVLLATNGREAVDIYLQKKGQISLVILDMTMPEMNGADTFAALQKLDPEVRVLISSGYDAEQASSDINGRGFLGVIQKPYRVNTLLETVRDTLSDGSRG